MTHHSARRGLQKWTGVLLVLALLLGIAPLSVAQSETTLRVELKGVFSTQLGSWRSIDLSARFQVLVNGAELATLTANPTDEQREVGLTDTLSLPEGTTAVSLLPMAEDFDNGFACNGPFELGVQPGQENVAPIFAYAEQGYFTLQTVAAASGEAIGPAEYAVLDAAGNVALSFTTDETGAYASQTPLATGSYQLAQMRSPDGTLPLESAVALAVSTYFGRPEDIAAVRVANEATPVHNADVTALRWQTQALVEPLAEQAAPLRATLAGVCDGANTVPLRALTVTLAPLTLTDESGQALATANGAWLTSLRADVGTEGVALRVRPCDANGAALAELTAASGETLDLTAYQAAQVQVEYVNTDTGESVLPAGFEAGMLSAEWSLQPSAEAVADVRLEARVTYAYTYPGSDGESVVAADSAVPSAVAAVPVSDGRARLALLATLAPEGDALTLALDEARSANLPEELMLLCALPSGVRAVGSDALLYQPERDVVRFTLSQLLAGEARVSTVGHGEGLAVYALGARGLPVTARNPEGAALLADEYEANALFDAFLGTTDGLYAKLETTVSGAFANGDAPTEWQSLLQGTVAWTDGEPQAGVAVLVTADGVAYGALTNEKGRYALYAPSGVTVAQGALSLGLPARAVSDPAPGVTVTLGASCDVRLSRENALVGQALLDGQTALPGVLLTLYRGGAAVATATTDLAGAFVFASLADGEYELRAELPGELNAAFAQADGVAVADATHATLGGLLLSGGTEVTCALQAASLCSLEGVALLADAGAPGVALTLRDAAGAVYQAQTDDAGRFTLAGIPAGAYTLAVEPGEGRILTALNGEAAVGTEFPVTVSASMGEYQLALEATASLRGVAAIPQAGQTVTVASAAGQVTAQTDEDGAFALDGLSAGEYTLYMALPQERAVTADCPWQPTQQRSELWLTVTLQAGEQLALPAVTLSARVELGGTAYLDANLSGARDADEAALSGVSVTLQGRAADGTWQTLATQQTGADGGYRFTGLGAGAYRVLAVGTGDWAVATVGESAEAVAELGAVASQAIELGDAQPTGACDIRLAQPARVTLHAFVDENGNGICGEYEDGLAGVRVEAVWPGDPTGSAIASGITDNQGNVTLSSLPAGDVALRITLPGGHKYTQRSDKLGLLHSLVGDTTELTAVSDALSLRAGEAVEVGAAAVPVGSLSGRVWNDLNGDGLISDDEPGIAGIEIHLRGSKTGDKYTLTTDETGLYCFSGLRNDTYIITSTLPDGMLFTRYTQTGGDLRSIYTGDLSRTGERQFVVSNSQDVTSKHIGLIYEGSITGLAFLDTNYNGYFDDGEPAYPNVRVELIKANTGDSLGRVTTGDDGRFTFGELRGSTYRVRVILPEDGSIFTVVPADTASDRANLLEQRTGRRENSIEGFVLQNGQTGQVMIGVAMPASVLGTVFLDQNYDGLLGGSEKKVSGMTVRLLNEQGELAAETTTVGNGRYKLEGVMPGTYTVAFERRSADEAFTRLPDAPGEGGNTVVRLEGEWGLTGPVTVTMGVDVKNINAGVLPSATITGMLFDDLNDDGLRDADENGAIGATVELLSEAGETVYTREVGEDGSYFFDGILPGSYTLRYRLLPHTELAKLAEGGNTLTGEGLQGALFEVAVGEAVQAPLVGVVTLGSLEGVAFHDSNANGVQDDGEEPLMGVTLSVTRRGDEAMAVQTGADGAFSLTGLRPGSYRLALQAPEGYIFSADLGDLALGMADTATLALPWEALTSRAVYALGCVRPASVTVSLWLDENMDGARTEGEAAVPGLGVALTDETTGKTMSTLLTDADGVASFPAVRPGSYTLQFTLPQQAQPATSRNTFVQLGSAMRQTGLLLAEGQAYADATCGLISRTSIAGCVNLDEAGWKAPQEGLTVRLYQDGGEKPVQTVQTTGNGSYRFDGLWPAAYVVEVEQPTGTLFASKQDPNYDASASAITTSDGQNGRTEPIQLRMAAHRLDVDVVLVKPAVVGELAWLDLNQNGLIDLGEPGIPGVTVTLLQNGQAVDTATTDAYGYYVFDDVYPGDYQLQAAAYPELTLTKRVPGMPMITSCLVSGDGALATSEVFTVVSGQRYAIYHMGYALLGEDWPDAIVTPPSQDWTHGYDYLTK